jgi:hypothetical protein
MNGIPERDAGRPPKEGNMEDAPTRHNLDGPGVVWLRAGWPRLSTAERLATLALAQELAAGASVPGSDQEHTDNPAGATKQGTVVIVRFVADDSASTDGAADNSAAADSAPKDSVKVDVLGNRGEVVAGFSFKPEDGRARELKWIIELTWPVELLDLPSWINDILRRHEIRTIIDLLTTSTAKLTRLLPKRDRADGIERIDAAFPGPGSAARARVGQTLADEWVATARHPLVRPRSVKNDRTPPTAVLAMREGDCKRRLR